MNIWQHNTFDECVAALKSAAGVFERTPRKDVASVKRRWAALLFKLREFMQTVEILSDFNVHCAVENLRSNDVLGENGQPTIEQLCRNFMNEGGNVSFRKKWPLIRKEILSPLNRWGAAQRFFRKPDVFDCAIHYLDIGGLDRFWAAHPEFMRQETPDLVFEKNAA
ncbi:MAG: hypothetical protein JW699_05010 [Chitinispirillaceae bacterium]|nr:hypothetical protein [Chitinispirillaceae bacterium]